jgi:hypothetical protein
MGLVKIWYIHNQVFNIICILARLRMGQQYREICPALRAEGSSAGNELGQILISVISFINST